MANYKLLIPFIKRWEGGFVNDPDDLGGATMCGVTIGTYTTYCKIKGKPKPSIQDLKRISEQEWEDIFKTLYWDRWKADKIESQRVANILVDWVWASGSYGITEVQKHLKLKIDGIVGAKTLEAVNARGEAFSDTLLNLRRQFIDRICQARKKNMKFRKGWLNRINSL